MPNYQLVAWALAETDRRCDEHIRDCLICERPDPSHPTYHRYEPVTGRIVETCIVGKVLAEHWLTLWRRKVDALSGIGVSDA